MTPPILVAARAHHPILEVTLPRDPPTATQPITAIAGFAKQYAPSCFVDIGTACPLHCVYCSVDRGADDRAVRMEAREHVYQRLADVEAAGVPKVTLIGGEPVARPDLLHLIDVAHALGIADVMLATKSVKLARPEFVADLAAHRVSLVHLSLDSVDPAVLSALLASKTAPRHLLAGLEVLLAAQVPVFLFAVVTQLNLHGWDAYINHVAGLQQRHGVRIPVVMTPLKVQSRALRHRETLVAPLPDVARSVGTAIARAAMCDVTVVHKSMPACLLPEHADHALERYVLEGRLDPHTGQRLPDLPSAAMAFGPACSTCPLRPHCPGVDAAYAAWQGWSAFVPPR